VTFVRFISAQTDPDSRASQGLFQAAYALQREGMLAEHERLWFKEVVGWFEDNLKAPKRVDIQLRYDSKEYKRVVYWFRSGATEHIRRMREVASMLNHHGVAHRLLKTDKPGRIVYEDEFQVGAIPHRDGVN
jgi:hypothetical protein